MASEPPGPREERSILIVNLDSFDWAKDEFHVTFIQQLCSLAQVTFVRDVDSLSKSLANEPSAAVLLAYAEITDDEDQYSGARGDLVRYVHNGGTLIMTGYFASFFRLNQDRFWFGTIWGLPWRTGGSGNRDIGLNEDAHGLSRWSRKLKARDRLKTLCLINVADSDCLYWTVSYDPEDSEDSEPPADFKEQASFAFAKLGQGHLAFIGDVNTEEVAQETILAMCGL